MKTKHGVIRSLAALAVLLAVVAAVAQWDTARAAPFNPALTVTLSDNAAGANADVTNDFSIPADNANYVLNISFTPVEFTRGTDLPLGAWVGAIDAQSTLGLLNNPCTTALPVSFKMLNASVNTADTLTFDDSYTDMDGNTLPDGVDKYPDFLNDIFPGLTPTMRIFGTTSAAGTAVTMNLVIFEPGTSLYGKTFDASLGRPSVSVLNNPAAALAPNPITDFCTPLGAKVTTYGISKDNPDTAADESGKVVSTNPTTAGDYKFTTYTTGQLDTDGDTLVNYIDTCPTVANTGKDSDNDGIDDACDPNPNVASTGLDEDGDGYMNRGDNCVLVANGPQQEGVSGVGNQLDSDADDLGDACDPNPTTPDGESAEVTLESTVSITGGAAATPTTAPAATPTTAPAATATVVATPKATAVATPKATATAAATPTPAGKVEVGGAGLLGSEGGFPMWAVYVIGVAAALMLGGIGTAASVVWRRRR